ncbi:PDT-domain-containing protein [Aspergillus sclerotioniger CBS 115572]|uniref:prephenate dehydratase n=1 Tax=Aspergillus sclerotioniger CBS 115572 TaxID=1450535 RepID=A0A317WN68_9EURO|nr:PDT-domain-containing protein [Aspergillus sclerotioniger CBS 115572]PWY85670.1 PDT-domain-containing protein [Aspergillus sclerotioniger CBS 115572]
MEPLKVAFLGPAASFSHQAAVESFGSSAKLVPHVSFPDAFAAVQADKVDYAIIPCENSTNGSVVQTLDLLADPSGLYSDVKVCGEHYLTVHHCLLTRKGLLSLGPQNYGSITKLYTHPQAWGQCEDFLERTFKGIERQDVSSTSKGAEIVSKGTTERSGAIASRFAAEYHGLDVSEENIEDKANNTTRFLVLRNVNSGRTSRLSFEDVKVSSPAQGQASVTPTAQKTLISFMIRQDCPGVLADALLIFKNQGMNLTSINSRPSQIRAWKYVFLVEGQYVPTNESQGAVSGIIDALQEVTEGCRHLGTWADQFVSV